MATNVYECMFILDSNRYAREPNAVTGTIPQMVEKCGGELMASRLWNEQKLAYQINNQRKGTYWLTYFRMDSQKITEFNRECQLNNHVLRNLVLKVDPRLVGPLVAHARGEAPPEVEEEAVETSEAANEAATAAATSADPPAEGETTGEGGAAGEGEATGEGEAKS